MQVGCMFTMMEQGDERNQPIDDGLAVDSQRRHRGLGPDYSTGRGNDLRPKHDTIEQIVTRLSYEPGIAAVSWSVVPTMME